MTVVAMKRPAEQTRETQPATSYFTVFDLYSPEEAAKLLACLPDEWRQGKARTPELTGTVKRNEELQSKDSEIVASICKAHAKRLAEDRGIKTKHIVKGVSPPKFNRYSGSGEYRRHTDSPVMSGIRTDLACTTFLSDPDSYEGGELNVEDHYGAVHSIKGRAGQAVIYPCGQPHWVSPVASGERTSLICWMQSYVRDRHKRGLLSTMMASLTQIEGLTHDDDLIRGIWTDLGSVHADLFRMWME